MLLLIVDIIIFNSYIYHIFITNKDGREGRNIKEGKISSAAMKEVA